MTYHHLCISNAVLRWVENPFSQYSQSSLSLKHVVKHQFVINDIAIAYEYSMHMDMIHYMQTTITKRTGGRLNIKMSSYLYSDPHIKDKTNV